jgi:hypothetical protein
MNGLNNLVRGLFLSLDIEPYVLATCKPLSTFLGPSKVPNGPKMKKEHKNLFSGCFGQFILKEWA